MKQLIAFIKAREELRKQKELGGPPPWTTDPILQQYRFCNIRRKDDRVSRWLRANVLTGANLQVGFTSFIQFTAFCRWNNWPPTIAEVMAAGFYPQRTINWKRVIDLVEARKARKEKTWTGAYMIKAPPAAARQTKAGYIAYICQSLTEPDVLPRLEKAFEAVVRRDAWEVVSSIKNWGSFMSGQAVDDWSWTLLLGGAKDTNTWAPQGPGSLRGFNRVLGLPLKTRHTEGVWCNQLQAWRAGMIEELGREYRDATLHDIQNSLCELDKYLRTKNGEGRPRSKYRPEIAY